MAKCKKHECYLPNSLLIRTPSQGRTIGITARLFSEYIPIVARLSTENFLSAFFHNWPSSAGSKGGRRS